MYDMVMAPERKNGTRPGTLLGYLLKRAHQRMVAVSSTALEPLGVGRSEFAVLRALAAHEPLSQQTLAAHLGIDPTTMVALIDALQSRSILTRRPDPADRRRNAIQLTEAGRTLCQDAEAAYAEAEGRFLAPLGEAEALRFRCSLETLLGQDGSLADA